MFHHILVPLDGSLRAEQALAVAAKLARACNGTVVLFQAIPLPPAFAFDLALPPSAIDTTCEYTRSYLKEVANSDMFSGIHVETDVAIGRAASAILAATQSHMIDLIVLCSHGYTGFKRWMLGSVAQQVVHHSMVPVLLLREGRSLLLSTSQQKEKSLRVLVPLDGSVQAKTALEPAAHLIASLSAPVTGTMHLMHVVVSPSRQRIEMGNQESRARSAKRYLCNTIEHLREGLVAPSVATLKLSLNWSVVADDDVATGIVRAAEQEKDGEEPGGCDVVAMATHGYSGLQRWAMGSVTERVLYASKVPMLIVRQVKGEGQL